MNGQTDSIAAVLQTQNWLEPLQSGLRKGVDAAFRRDSAKGKPLENALHGLWLGHPLHPVLTDVPVGAWTVAFILDLIEEIPGATRFSAGADAAVKIGIAGACAAAITGLTDWKDIDNGARRTGLVHALLNTVALGLYVSSAVQRSRQQRGSGRMLGYLGYAVSAGSAWLGGHLSFTNRIGVARLSEKEPPLSYEAVLPAGELEELKPRKVDCAGYPVVLVKRYGRILALADTCTHAAGSLSEGTIEGDCIRCPLHGSLFSLTTGEVIESPSVYPVQAFETRIHDGQIEVRVPGR